MIETNLIFIFIDSEVGSEVQIYPLNLSNVQLSDACVGRISVKRISMRTNLILNVRQIQWINLYLCMGYTNFEINLEMRLMRWMRLISIRIVHVVH